MPKRSLDMPKILSASKIRRSGTPHIDRHCPHNTYSPFSSRNLWRYKNTTLLQSKAVVPTTKQASTSKPKLLKVGPDTYDLVGTSPVVQDRVRTAAPMKRFADKVSRFASPRRKSGNEAAVVSIPNVVAGPARSFISVTGDQMARFLELLELPIIKKFLSFDICLRVTDKYLLAMAFAYFARAKLHPDEYTSLNLFVALYLAHDVEEDEEDYKYEIFPWALGKMWRVRHKILLNMRDKLWKRMDYRAIVSRKCCEEIMSIEPGHAVWKRERQKHHAGAIRPWLKEPHDDGKLIGPDGSPRHCDWCKYPPQKDDDHDSLSPENDHVYLQLDSSTSSVEEYSATDITNNSTATGFNMNELQQTLMCSGKTYSSGKGRSFYSSDTTLDWVDCSSEVVSPFNQPEV